ncbi:MAG: protein-export chaperone SecB [candidate division KSB1 bacterium]|nr:protein-export chaperone SecB [candidate division KSB1 bacterium]
MPNISPEHYRKTLETIELLNISCIKMSAHISHELLTPQMNISIRDQASFENIDQGFKVENKYTLTSKNNEKKTAIKIECVYLITFKSSKDIDEDFFDIYKTHSLPLNVWPFFREYVNSLTSRMNIQPLTLPLMKR